MPPVESISTCYDSLQHSWALDIAFLSVCKHNLSFAKVNVCFFLTILIMGCVPEALCYCSVFVYCNKSQERHFIRYLHGQKFWYFFIFSQFFTKYDKKNDKWLVSMHPLFHISWSRHFAFALHLIIANNEKKCKWNGQNYWDPIEIKRNESWNVRHTDYVYYHHRCLQSFDQWLTQLVSVIVCITLTMDRR